jgi:hypothetical protein
VAVRQYHIFFKKVIGMGWKRLESFRIVWKNLWNPPPKPLDAFGIPIVCPCGSHLLPSAPIQINWNGPTNLFSSGEKGEKTKVAGFWETVGWIILLGVCGLVGRFISYILFPENLTRLKTDEDLGRDIFSGVVAGLLVPVFLAVLSGHLLPSESTGMPYAFTVISFGLVAGIIGIEFIRGVVGLVRRLTK